MTYLRFDCFNWNSVCNTALEILIQTKADIVGALSAEESKSDSLIQPPHRTARRPAGRAFESTRAVYAARSLPHARAGPQNRASGTHAGVDRGDGIVTDGGQDARPTREVDHPKTCETDDCHRRAIYLIKGAHPPDTEQRVVCEPCYNMFQWCSGVPYSDVWSEQIRPKTATDGGTTPQDDPESGEDENCPICGDPYTDTKVHDPNTGPNKSDQPVEVYYHGSKPFCSRPLCATDGGRPRHENDQLATDGGTDTEGKMVSLRLDDPEIVAALESADSQSEAIRSALRETYADESDTDRDGDVPPKAAEAYDWLVDYCDVGGQIGIETARSLIAQKFQIKTDAVDNLVIRPLHNNDWIGVSQGIQSVSIVVKPKPVDQTAPMEGGEPADD